MEAFLDRLAVVRPIESAVKKQGEGETGAEVAERGGEGLGRRVERGDEGGGFVAALFNLYKNTRTQLENVMAQLSSEERGRTSASPRPRLGRRRRRTLRCPR